MIFIVDDVTGCMFQHPVALSTTWKGRMSLRDKSKN